MFSTKSDRYGSDHFDFMRFWNFSMKKRTFVSLPTMFFFQCSSLLWEFLFSLVSLSLVARLCSNFEDLFSPSSGLLDVTRRPRPVLFCDVIGIELTSPFRITSSIRRESTSRRQRRRRRRQAPMSMWSINTIERASRGIFRLNGQARDERLLPSRLFLSRQRLLSFYVQAPIVRSRIVRARAARTTSFWY